MAAIDLIVLGMLKREPLSAYELQKLVDYRHISRWVKISTPSIYKKVLQLEEKGLLRHTAVRENNMPEKAVYALTEAGEQEFVRLMKDLSAQPIRILMDLNAVIVNLGSLPPEQQHACIADIGQNIGTLKETILKNLQEKSALAEIPPAGLAVLRQQLALAEAMEVWLSECFP